MYGIFQWTKDGLVDVATAHDKTDADRTRDDYTAHGLLTAGFVAPTRKISQPATGLPAWMRKAA